MIPALALILAFQLGGEVAARGLGLPLPGPVVGMVALLGACLVRPALAGLLRPVAGGLLAHLSLFFVPAGVGVIAHLPLLRSEGAALAAAVAVSTILAILAGAWAFAAVARLTGSRDDG